MKTLLVFSEVPDYQPKFIILDGDYTRFDGIYVNKIGVDKDLENELVELMYNDDGSFRFPWPEHTTQITPKCKWDEMAICGFIM